MASTWGDSWGVSWGVSWDIGSAPVELLAGGKTWHREFLKAQERLKERPEVKAIQKSAVILATAGGYARAESLTAKQRSSIASKAARTRWK